MGHPCPDSMDLAELVVQVSYSMDTYEVKDILGCLSDGYDFFYYMFTKNEQNFITIAWKKIVAYSRNPTSEEIKCHIKCLHAFIVDKM